MMLSVALSVIAAMSDPGLVVGAPMRLAGSHILPTGPVPALDLRVVERRAGAVVVEARLRAPDGRALAPDAIGARLGRPTHAREDRPVVFEPAPDGGWRATIARPAGGDWELAVEARAAEGAAAATLRL
jgi:hypothetical protein